MTEEESDRLAYLAKLSAGVSSDDAAAHRHFVEDVNPLAEGLERLIQNRAYGVLSAAQIAQVEAVRMMLAGRSLPMVCVKVNPPAPLYFPGATSS